MRCKNVSMVQCGSFESRKTSGYSSNIIEYSPVWTWTNVSDSSKLIKKNYAEKRNNRENHFITQIIHCSHNLNLFFQNYYYQLNRPPKNAPSRLSRTKLNWIRFDNTVAQQYFVLWSFVFPWQHIEYTGYWVSGFWIPMQNGTCKFKLNFQWESFQVYIFLLS